MYESINFSLLTVGVAVASIGVLGFTVFWSDTKSATNRAFFFFSLVSVAWTISNYAQHNLASVPSSFVMLKVVIFLAVLHAFTFFRLLYVFPEAKKELPTWFNSWAVPFITLVAALTLTPFVFKGVLSVDETGKIAGVENGPGIILFSGTVTILIVGAIVVFFKKIRKATREA